MDLATDPSVYGALSELNYEALLQSLDEMASFGITSVCDARCFWRRQHHVAWERALRENKLTVRAVLGEEMRSQCLELLMGYLYSQTRNKLYVLT
jgi:hypothetical protein